MKHFVQIIVLAIILKELFFFLKKFKKNVSFFLIIWKNIDLKKILFSIFLLTTTIISYSIFSYFEILNIGYGRLLFQKNTSIILQPLTEENNTNSILLIVNFIFILLLIFMMPVLVSYEEKIFRFKKLNLYDRVKNSFSFGILHMIMGIDLSAALALSINGFVLSELYKRKYEVLSIKKENGSNQDHEQLHEKALITTTEIHTYYNTIILIIVLLFFTFS